MVENSNMTGYPSIDKPWLKYYSEEAINAKLPECSAYEYIYNINKQRPNKAALNYYGKKTSYEQMFLNIDKCAKALKAFGVKQGEIVSVSMPNSPEAVYLFYAISKVGAVANMIDPRTSSDGFADYINETSSTKLFVIDIIADKITAILGKTALKKVVTISPANSLPVHLKAFMTIKNKISATKNSFTDWNSFMRAGNDYRKIIKELKGASNAPVLIVHTGGTTGSPKGVLLSNSNINAIAFQSLLFPTDLQTNHVWLDIMPPFIAYGIGSGLHFPLAKGQEVVLIPAFKPEEFDKLILKYRPNHISGVPSHWNNIIHSKKLKNEDLSFLITCAVGGDAMNTELEKASNDFLRAHNCNYCIAKGYGMSEVNGSIGRTINENNPIGNVGIPFTHSIVKVCDPETGKELRYNETGEIYMTGPSVMLGYYNNKEETDNIKVKDDNGVYWIKSGDLGYMTEDGKIFIKGRIKRMVIRHDGFKIFPSMIENIVNKNINVILSCAVGKSDPDHVQGKMPIVYVVLRDKANSSTVKQSLKKLCKKELPEYAQPIDFVIIDKLPLTPIGKIDYRTLEQMAEKENDNE